jgi:hypothetical protein
VVIVALAGCATKAPNYAASPETTQGLQLARAQSARVGEFTAAATANNTGISLRASRMEPPQGTFAKYLEDAVRAELELARLYAPASKTEISGVLIRNDLDTGVVATGQGVIEAKFVVRREGAVLFDKTKVARIEWDTNYFASIAIPRALQEYSRLVRKLVTDFFSDPDFVAALK